MTSLSAVRTALEKSGSDHATLFTALIDNGKVGSRKCRLESKARQRFGPSEAHFPQIGKKLSPFDASKLPSIRELQEICLRDLPAVREYYGDRLVYYAPSVETGSATDATRQDPSIQLINSLTNVDINATGAVASFPSETLGDMCLEGSFVEPDNLLRANMTTCTIMPSDNLISLQHSNEGTTITTLLSGSVIWIIWPPTDHNLSVLQTAYQDFAEDWDEARLGITQDLEGGLMFVQVEGEALRIPPLCPMMGLATKTTVLATKSMITVDNFISMLRHVSLLKAWFKTELDGERKQSEFNAALLKWLDLLLNGEIDPETEKLDPTHKLPFTENGPLHKLLRTWDDMSDGIKAMLGATDAEIMMDIWSAFLIESKGRECRICDKSIRNKQKLMRKHFLEQHWPNDKLAERVDSMDVVGVDEEEGDEGGIEPSKVTEDTPVEQAGEPMEWDF